MMSKERDVTVRVTTTTEVIDEDGKVLSKFQVSAEETGQPYVVTRMAHRRAEECSDNTRVVLGSLYGEPDARWQQ